MARCLVTGGAGFIGSNLVEHLLERGHRVAVLDDLSTGREENLRGIASHPNLSVRIGSITDPVLLAEVARDVEVIYHLAAAVGVRLVADDPVRTIVPWLLGQDSVLAKFHADATVNLDSSLFPSLSLFGLGLDLGSLRPVDSSPQACHMFGEY